MTMSSFLHGEYHKLKKKKINIVFADKLFSCILQVRYV